MKITIPEYGFSYEVTKDGLKSVGQIFDSPTDRRLYLAILDNLQQDFKNSAINTANGNALNQKVQYLIDVNKYLSIETDEPLTITKYAEVMDVNQLRRMTLANPALGVYPDTTDLQ